MNRFRLAILTLALATTTSCTDSWGSLSISGTGFPDPAASNEIRQIKTLAQGDNEERATVQANVPFTQMIITSQDSSLAGIAASFPPGSLAIDTDISFAQGEPLAGGPASQSSGVAIVEGSEGTAISVEPSVDQDPIVPFTLALPKPLATLQLTQTSVKSLAVLYKIKNFAKRSESYGVIESKQISVEDNVVRFSALHFGTFQVVYVHDSGSPSVISTRQVTKTAASTATASTTTSTVDGSASTGSTSTATTSIDEKGQQQAVPIAPPQFSLLSGSYPGPQTLVINGEPGVSIHYTMDGNEPGLSSEIYSQALTITHNQTIKAVAIKDGQWQSSINLLELTINGQLPPPRFLPAAGEVPWGQPVTIMAEPGAQIFYTMDGTTPDRGSHTYTGPLPVTTAQGIKAIAVHPQWLDSIPAFADYTIASTITGPACANETVNSIVSNQTTTFIGGNFTHVGTCTGAGIVVDDQAGALAIPLNSLPDITGVVYAAIDDGNGGWIIGGQFSFVAGTARQNLARINADGSLHPWSPAANSAIYSLARSGTTLYVGGAFTTIASEPRSYFAAFDLQSGNLTALAPNPTGAVYSLALTTNQVLYIGGNFGYFANAPRSRLAAINLADASSNLLPWNPGANGAVRALSWLNDRLYVGGDFSSIGSSPSAYVAAFDTSSGDRLATWNPVVSGPVAALAAAGTSVYIGGNFSTVGGQAQAFFAAVSNVDGALDSEQISLSGSVSSLIISQDHLYVGGSFTNIGGVMRSHAAKISLTTRQVVGWNPSVNAAVSAISVVGGKAFLGGIFNAVGSQPRNSLAAIDKATGSALPWHPNINGSVQTLAIAPGNDQILYVGGLFNTVGSVARENLAAIDTTTANPTVWSPRADAPVLTIKIDSTLAYVGGEFLSINSLPRTRIAAIELTSGNVTSWDPKASAAVHAIALGADTVFVGGAFTTIAGQPHNYVAGIDKATAEPTPFNLQLNARVYALGLDGQTLYVGGSFTTVNNQTRSGLVAADTAIGSIIINSWIPVLNGSVFSLALSPTTVYVGGSFFYNGATVSKNFLAVNMTSPSLTSSPDNNQIVRTIDLDLTAPKPTATLGGQRAGLGKKSRNPLRLRLDTLLSE